MQAHVWVSPRIRFVLRRGVFPWGLFAGLAAAAVAAFWAAGDAHAASALRTIILCIVCFVIWTLLVGWTIGLIRWELRPPGADSMRPNQTDRSAP